MASLALMGGALSGFVTAPIHTTILFAASPVVPPSVQEFAARVIEAHCEYQLHERARRSFWAYETRVTRAEAGTVYSIKILSDVTWNKREPSAMIEMTIVDDGGPGLTALKSSFIGCAP